ncbi:MAG TPA: aminoglycoside phosphotransferase family protein, partial [Holophagaceae bacterium]|nr:aminoglycoside phosphotransferase family protein [Holophagaceae bacterium]
MSALAALAAAAAFPTPGAPREATRLGEGAGHIHQTWRVDCAGGAVVLQRLNEAVFPDLDAVMANLAAVTAHLQAQLAGHPDAARRALALIPARAGGWLHRDSAGRAWRCTRFIPGARMPLEPAPAEEARAAAQALGRFLGQLSDLPAAALREPLPGFHDTAARLQALERAAVEGCARDAADALAFARSRAALASALPALELPLRPVHNDTKLANVLLDAATGEGLCVLDLDTVMPGLAATDFGDLARSAAFDGGEGDADIRLDLDRLRALAEGYLEGAGGSLSPAERGAFGLGARVIAYELGLRFLADHLAGDRYFGATEPG